MDQTDSVTSTSVLSPFENSFADYIDLDNPDSFTYSVIRSLLVNRKALRFSVDLDNLRRFDSQLAQSLLLNPSEVLPALEEKLNGAVAAHPDLGALLVAIGKPSEERPHAREHNRFRVALDGAFGSHSVRPGTLGASFFGRLVKVSGVVTKTTPVRPRIRRSVHFCPTTGVFLSKEFRGASDLGALPTSSSYLVRDEEGNSLETEFGLSIFEDGQVVQLQDAPEHSSERTGVLNVLLESDLVDSCKPGDRVAVVGVYRPVGGKAAGLCKTIARAFLVANRVVNRNPCNIAETFLAPEAEERQLDRKENETEEALVALFGCRKKAAEARTLLGKESSPEEVAVFKTLKEANVSVLGPLAESLLPHVYGLSVVKKAVLLQLLSGTEVFGAEGLHVRGDIHVLLLGDPSTAKSQVLRSVLALAPLAVSASGRGSSGVGLTAAVAPTALGTKAGEDFELDAGRALEAGAMVRADRGLVCIDEFDKMADGDRVALHEVLEQQTVTIAKAGLHCSLNARCSVLAAANPAFSFYDDSRSVQENVALPDSLLSRFDLVFVLRDVREAQQDRRVAKHVLANHRTVVQSGQHKLTPAGVMRYVQLCKQCSPKLSSEAAQLCAKSYAEIRQKENAGFSVPVTPRTLEALVRLATAAAKARFAEVVLPSDVAEALSVMAAALEVDLNGVCGTEFVSPTVSASVNTRLSFEEFLDVLDKIVGEEKALTFRELTDGLAALGMNLTEHELRGFLQKLEDEDKIMLSDDIVYFV